jgi:hypothetical protein
MKAIAKLVFLFCFFVVVFFVTTAFFDTLEHRMGYYDQGIKESSEVGQ